MDYLEVFLSQVIVLLLMLLGMILGDVAATSIFGRVKTTLRQIIYLLLFVIFLVIGNYLPAMLRIPNPSLYTAVLLYGLWGFLAVFISRGILHLADFIMDVVQRLLNRNACKRRNISIEYKSMEGFLRGKVDSDKLDGILNEITESRKRDIIYVNPRKLCHVLAKEKLTRDDILCVLVKYLKISPEHAVFISRDVV